MGSRVRRGGALFLAALMVACGLTAEGTPTTGDTVSADSGGNADSSPCGVACVDATVDSGLTETGTFPVDGDTGLDTLAPDGTAPIVFGYVPSNFTAGSYMGDVPLAGTVVQCNMTYTSPGTAGPSTWCGATGPYVVPNVAQSGGPSVDILVFRSLSIHAGDTLTLAGTNPVILAVYGDASVSGTVDASGGPGSQGPTDSTGTPGTPATPGAGGNWSCASSAGVSPTFNRPGGGGGGTAEMGAMGGSPPDTGGSGGSARGSSVGTPLLGGCPGGNSGTECQASGGAGGGAVQLSAAGTLTLTGSVVNTSGGAGGAGRREGNGTNQCNQGAGAYTGGGGGGSAGDIVIEGSSVTGGTQTGKGGPGGVNGNGSAGGAGGTATVNGAPGTAPTAGGNGGNSNNGGSGGGGSGGYVVLNLR